MVASLQTNAADTAAVSSASSRCTHGRAWHLYHHHATRRRPVAPEGGVYTPCWRDLQRASSSWAFFTKLMYSARQPAGGRETGWAGPGCWRGCGHQMLPKPSHQRARRHLQAPTHPPCLLKRARGASAAPACSPPVHPRSKPNFPGLRSRSPPPLLSPARAHPSLTNEVRNGLLHAPPQLGHHLLAGGVVEVPLLQPVNVHLACRQCRQLDGRVVVGVTGQRAGQAWSVSGHEEPS